MKIPMISMAILVFGSACYAGEGAAYGAAAKPLEQYQDGTTAQKPETESPATYDLNKWQVKTESGAVEDALAVFKRKGQPRYKQKVWIIDKNDNTKTYLVEYSTNDASQKKILFSPNEDFMFYLGLSPAGASVIYGMNLSTQEEFIVDSGVDFSIFSCPNNTTSYVVIEQNGAQQARYHIYNFNRQKIDVLQEGVSLDNMASYICQ